MTFEKIDIIDLYAQNALISEVKLNLASDEDVDFVEMMIEVVFPKGYREYVAALGKGEYCNLVRIDLPHDILYGYKKYRKFLDQYWFWDRGEKVLSKQRALESIKIGDTIDGHVIIFHPSNSFEIFLLPHEDELIYCIGSDLCEAIDWLCDYSRAAFNNSLQKNHGRKFFVPYK